MVEIPLAEAHDLALSEGEPVFVPCGYHTDDRGWSIMNRFQGVLSPAGQINYSVMYPGVIKAWHRHQIQTDFWLVLHGHLKAGVYRASDEVAWSVVMGEKRPGTLIIPPTLWHGAATIGDQGAGLLYYVTHAYNPASPDEERCGYDEINGFPWDVQFR
ncbi:MAG: hypothetical protein D8M59_08320 [Planctomycetes bacterium]|nr:hypothetical protein [Planctomycetota bacterium]